MKNILAAIVSGLWSVSLAAGAANVILNCDTVVMKTDNHVPFSVILNEKNKSVVIGGVEYVDVTFAESYIRGDRFSPIAGGLVLKDHFSLDRVNGKFLTSNTVEREDGEVSFNE